MKINALLDVNVVAHETEDEVAVLLELEAPAALADVTRPQASLQVVLDRSGSMDGAPLEGAKKALVALVRRLEPTDNFGLVTFDDSAQVVVPAGPLADKDAVIAQIQAVRAGGSTDLSAGYLRGLREIRRVARHRRHRPGHLRRSRQRRHQGRRRVRLRHLQGLRRQHRHLHPRLRPRLRRDAAHRDRPLRLRQPRLRRQPRRRGCRHRR